MAQFRGTGKDGFVKDQPFDIPDADVDQQEKVEEDGVGIRQQLVGQTGPDNPARRAVELADADLRDDPLAHPQDRAVVEKMRESREREIDQVHSDRAGAKEAGKVEAAAAEHPPEAGSGAHPDRSAGHSRSQRSRDEAKGDDDKSKSKGDDDSEKDSSETEHKGRARR